MAIDRSYIPAFSLDNVFRDKDTGEPLANGTLEFFINNTSVQKDVYQIAGTSPNYTFTPLPNPMTLSLAGTLVDGAGNPVIPYFFPFDAAGNPEYYDVVCKSSGGVTQFTREAVPYIPDLLSPGDGASNYTNELSNPQFVEVLFDTESPSHTYTFSGASLEEVPLAPDWDLVVTGTGDVVVSRIAPVGSLNIITNPPYLLQINSSGAITVLRLRQRLPGNPGIWANGSLSSSFVGKTNSSAVTMTMRYEDSNGTSTTLVTGTFPSSGVYTQLTGNVTLGASSNPDTADDGYVDIIIDLPTTVQIQITSLQVVFTGDAVVTVPYDQTTKNRQIDHLFNYYKPKLSYKPMPSYLVGWDFPLNPAQFDGHRTQAATAIGANASKYVWDQTLIFQSANSGVGVSGGSAGEIVLTANNTTQMAIIQYLPAEIARQILNDRISVNVQAKASAPVNATVSLWYTTDATLPVASPGTNQSLVATLGANGKPATFHGNWTEVPRQKLGDALFEIGTNATTNFNNYAFSGWDLEGAAAANTATFFAIVIGTASVASNGTVRFYNVGLCRGDIPTPPAPKTFEQTLKECEYYYEKSYNFSTPPGTATGGNSVLIRQSDEFDIASTPPAHNWYRAPFTLEYKTIKRSNTPAITFYDIAGNQNQIRYTVYDNTNPAASSGGAVFVPTPAQTNIASSGWSILNRSNKRTTYVINTSAPVVQEVGSGAHQGALAAVIDFHYVVDARLGIV